LATLWLTAQFVEDAGVAGVSIVQLCVCLGLAKNIHNHDHPSAMPMLIIPK